LSNLREPTLSIIVIAFNMAREIPRTLHTLSPQYQRNVSADDYEVIVVDNGSHEPLQAEMVASFGPNFRLIRLAGSPSPAPAINIAVEQARGEAVSICIDGARMLTPGIVRLTLQALAIHSDPLISSIGLHLGPLLQNKSMLQGYNQQVEDALLNTVNWRQDGYELFRISCLAGSSEWGWFRPIAESNFVSVRRSSYDRLGGFDEQFTTPGGGLVNLDFYKNACEQLDQVVMLLGEGSFHQFHGGVATNIPMEGHPGPGFAAEYHKIRGRLYDVSERPHQYLGELPPQALPLLLKSLRSLEEAETARPAPDSP
jgi:glycosyltransferase involved in cell wall biosynthesis